MKFTFQCAQIKFLGTRPLVCLVVAAFVGNGQVEQLRHRPHGLQSLRYCLHRYGKSLPTPDTQQPSLSKGALSGVFQVLRASAGISLSPFCCRVSLAK